MAFVSEFLGPAFRSASIDTKIWILDHNYDLWGRALDELGDSGASSNMPMALPGTATRALPMP